ncbi:glycosyltransferase family protein [Devosia aurantiaca]|uniref:Glycosyltransferase family 1 protein n=1 Tax=Devosia aurantiaca TaxID=2714858 RepID=A0A6M1SC64_9HYPH|nr:hypothetical protein [Devosia aurantiaca]NGP17509.1 hypothetical protein [Devosia aurantiaca]
MKIRYISWADNTGYAVAAKSYLFAFYRAGQNISWTPMLPNKHGYSPSSELQLGDSVLAGLLAKGGDYDLMVIHTVPEYYAPWVAEARSKGKRVLGYTVWELERLPDHWPAILNQLDAVVVPCSWNVEVFRHSGVTVPIHVVPHLSQFGDLPGQVLREADYRWLPATATSPDRFMFYSIGHWSNRKAPNLVVQAFLRAFGANDPVSLLVKTSRNDVTRWHRHWRNAFRRRHPSPMLELRRMLKDREPLLQSL